MTKLDLTSATRLLRTKILAYYVQLSSSMRIRDWILGESFGMIHLKRTGSKEWFAHESDISRTRLSSREREQLTHTNTNRGESKETLSKFSACPTTHTHTHTRYLNYTARVLKCELKTFKLTLGQPNDWNPITLLHTDGPTLLITI